MLDFGWPELLLVIIIAVFAIGPKEVPEIMYGIGRIVRRFQYFKFAISKQFDAFMDHVDIEELRTASEQSETIETDEKASDEQS